MARHRFGTDFASAWHAASPAFILVQAIAFADWCWTKGDLMNRNPNTALIQAEPVRTYYVSSSEIFGGATESRQVEAELAAASQKHD